MTHKRFKSKTIVGALLLGAFIFSAGFTFVKNKRFAGNVYVADAIYSAALQEYATAIGVYVDDVYILDESIAARTGDWVIDPTGYHFNVDGLDADYKIESDTVDILVVDAGNDSIGIGGAPAPTSTYSVSIAKDVQIYDAANSTAALYFTNTAYGIGKTAGHDLRLFTTTGDAILSATGSAGNGLKLEADGDVIVAGDLMIGTDQSPESTAALHVKNGDSGVSFSAQVGLIVENNGSHQAYIHLIAASGNGETFRVTNAKSVIIGNDDIATTSTDGFLFLPSMEGKPSGTVYEWDDGVGTVYDSTNDKLFSYNPRDNTWRDNSIGETGTEYTIATGAITVVGDVMFTVDTQSDAASDDLDTVTMTDVSVGQLITLTAANSARTVVCKDATGNLQLSADFSLDHANDTIRLIWDGSNWLQIATANNN